MAASSVTAEWLNCGKINHKTHMPALSPLIAAEIATGAYELRTSTVSELLAADKVLGCEGLFKVDDASRFTGKSGGYVFRQLSGCGYIAEGEGVHQGEILVATRGTVLGIKTPFDGITDAHTGLRRGPSGTPVHIGFQRVWESYVDEVRFFLQGKNPTHVHCVGHSLGGGLAMLNADYFAANNIPVSVYTFGCPRVGMRTFSEMLTRRVGSENIYRVSHDTDPVTMLPAFPFVHAPFHGKHYTVARGGMIGMGAHFMEAYVGTVSGKSWSSLANALVPVDWTEAVARVWLDAVKSGDGGISMYAGASLEMIAHALRWLIRKAISLGFVFPSSNIAGGLLTAVDLLATLVDQSAKLSKEIADDVGTIMSAILRFLGRSAVTASEVTHQFIKWVFDLLHGTIKSMADGALMRGNHRS